MGRLSAGFRALSIGGAALLGACRSVEDQDLSPARVASPADQWVLAAENDSLRISIDTVGWEPDRPHDVLWIAIADVSTPEKRRSASPFLRIETRQELDCRNQRARSLDIRTPDSSGTWSIHPTPDSAWCPFATAGLDRSSLVPVCARLAQLSASGR